MSPHEDKTPFEPNHFINDYKKCPQCGGTNFEVRNYDLMWHDGDVYCIDCNVWVRTYDAG